ncbi:hypothetical protein GCM10011514_21070 [Emticicia aquatilis]|uniref:Uncharacterized protein n=1 Tax=Emticicia aquatilis TaxID=1537369 RepID=A0A916YQC1_9BACT|nr:hypothetical protein GCM10011514_21070 [Emticicia aquatilis]
MDSYIYEYSFYRNRLRILIKKALSKDESAFIAILIKKNYDGKQGVTGLQPPNEIENENEIVGLQIFVVGVGQVGTGGQVGFGAV